MLTIQVRGLPRSMTEQALTDLFGAYGKVRSLRMARDLFTGECRGLAQLQIRRQRQRGGALHAHAHATCQGCGIGMLHPVLGDQHGRPRIGRCAGPPGFQRQRRQVQGHPQHGERRAGPAR